MSWLRTAEPTDELFILSVQLENVAGAVSRVQRAEDLVGSITALESILTDLKRIQSTTTASVYDDPSYQRDDLNKGESGEFDENGIDDKRKDFSVDPGPASATPGTIDTISPDIFE